MADKLVPSLDDGGAIRRFRDMADGTWAEVVATSAGSAGAAGYPTGATPVRATATGSNATTAASLAAAVGKTTYLSSIIVSGLSPTAVGSNGLTLNGVLGGAITYSLPLPAASAQGAAFQQIDFNPPIPASAVNTAISASSAAFGAGSTYQMVEVVGFQL